MEWHSTQHYKPYSKLFFGRQLQTLARNMGSSLEFLDRQQHWLPSRRELQPNHTFACHRGRLQLQQSTARPADSQTTSHVTSHPPILQTTAVNKVYNSGAKHCNKPSKTMARMARSRRDTALSELPFAVDDEQHIPDYSIMPRLLLHVLAGIDVAT